MTLTLCLFVFALAAPAVMAHGYPSWPMPKGWKPPAAWLRDALCIHRRESIDWYRRGVDWRGRPSPYYGGMQFLVDTWKRAGGSGFPSDATPREQLYRAYVIWDMQDRRRGNGRGDFSEWGTARACGLR